MPGIDGVLARAVLASELAQRRQVREVAISAPGAGVEVAQTVPGDTIWNILSARMLLTTSAVVANRVPSFRFRDSDGIEVGRYTSGATVTATSTPTLTWAAGAGFNFTSSPILAFLPPLPYPALPGWSVGTLTAGLDVGDAYSGVVLLVQEWSEDVIDAFAGYISEKLGNYYEWEGMGVGNAG